MSSTPCPAPDTTRSSAIRPMCRRASRTGGPPSPSKTRRWHATAAVTDSTATGTGAAAGRGWAWSCLWRATGPDAPAPGSDAAKKGVGGELGPVRGGGIYNPKSYLRAPATLPEKLHWFKWEAYTTWLSGTALLV